MQVLDLRLTDMGAVGYRCGEGGAGAEVGCGEGSGEGCVGERGLGPCWGTWGGP